MRYDDFDEYSNRSSRSSSRSSDRRSSGNRSYRSDRDYDRSYRSYDRDRDWDYDYDRSYDRDYRSSDRYSTRQSYFDDFDRSDWERTAPNWDDRSGARKKPSGSSRSGRSSSYQGGGRSGAEHRSAYDNRSRSSSGSRSGSGRDRDRDRERDRDRRRSSSSDRDRRRSAPPQKQKRSLPVIPMVLGLVFIVLAALIIKSFVGGGSNSAYEIELESQTIVTGETMTASISGLSETEEYDIVWASSENNVVSVEGDGKTCTLTAKKEGSTTIAATINGEDTIQKTVMVVDVAPGVLGIKLGQEAVEIKSGDTYSVQATVQMESDNMKSAKITWTTSDSSVARVDENGVITGRDVGSAIIKATAGEKTAEIVVTVVENPDASDHDESQNTGNEPEEGAVAPETGEGTGDGSANADANTTGGEGEGTATGDQGAGGEADDAAAAE